MRIINLSEKPSVLNQYIAEIRDINYHNNRRLFRQNIERIGEILAYHVSQELTYNDQATQDTTRHSQRQNISRTPCNRMYTTCCITTA